MSENGKSLWDRFKESNFYSSMIFQNSFFSWFQLEFKLDPHNLTLYFKVFLDFEAKCLNFFSLPMHI